MTTTLELVEKSSRCLVVRSSSLVIDAVLDGASHRAAIRVRYECPLYSLAVVLVGNKVKGLLNVVSEPQTTTSVLNVSFISAGTSGLQ
jgi:hypothetical protein